MNEPVAKRRPMIDLDEFERRLRQPAPPRKEDDPLVELAKLGDHENDPFKSVFDTPPAAVEAEPRASEKQSDNLSNPRRQDPLWEEQLSRTFGDDFSAIEAGLRNSSGHEASPRTPRSHYGDFVDHTISADSWPEDAEENYATDGPSEKRSRKPLYVMAGIIILGLAAIGGTFALKSMRSGQHEIALIKADSSPSKVQPSTAGDGDIAAQDDSILQKNSRQPGVAGVKSNSEQPVDLSQSQVQEKLPRVISLNQSGTVDAGGGAAAVPVPAPPPASQTQPQYDTAPQSIAALIEPKKVKTISVRPDGTILPNDMPPPVNPSIAPVPVPRPSSAALNLRTVTPKTVPRAGTTPRQEANSDQIAQLAEASPETAGGGNASKAVANAEAPGQVVTSEARAGARDGFSVQLAAPPTEQEARSMQIKLLKQYADVLSGQHSSIRRAGTADKPIYRIRVGTNLTREEAAELCQKVQGKGGTCFVAKNDK